MLALAGNQGEQKIDRVWFGTVQYMAPHHQPLGFQGVAPLPKGGKGPSQNQNARRGPKTALEGRKQSSCNILVAGAQGMWE